MQKAFALARRGTGKTSPNPLVGAVLARNGEIIGEGWHKRYGGAHAEEEALNNARSRGNIAENAGGTTLYCTLEPCSWSSPTKKRPPCTALIIKNKISRVVIAAIDPNPKVNGGGIALLKEAGIDVETGLFAEIDLELNRAFRAFFALGRPFVHIKIAQSLDGRIAAHSGDARWISCEASRKFVHKLRAFYDAVLVGRGALLADDPELTVRLVRGRSPLRVALDSALKTPVEAKIFDTQAAATVIFCREGADSAKIALLKSRGVEVCQIPAVKNGENDGEGGLKSENALPLTQILDVLAKKGLRSILVEGGGAVFGSFLKAGLWDRLTVFIAPLVLGEGVGAVSGFASDFVRDGLKLSPRRVFKSGADTVLEYERSK